MRKCTVADSKWQIKNHIGRYIDTRIGYDTSYKYYSTKNEKNSPESLTKIYAVHQISDQREEEKLTQVQG